VGIEAQRRQRSSFTLCAWSVRHHGDFRLAVRNRAGETTYFPIRCFGKLAESVTAIKKGTKVFVAGELEISTFTTEEGTKQMSYRVTAETYRILAFAKQASNNEVGIKP
jgi:single-stranded DNA-binding protein